VLNSAGNSAANLAVVSGARLAGTGMVTSAVTVNGGGTLSPGVPGSVGTFSITGSLVFQSAAIYMTTLSGASASLTSVTGNVTIAGGAVEKANALNALTLGSYNIIHTSGGGVVAGTFADMTFFSGQYKYTITYPDSQDVDLTVAQGLITTLLPPNAPINVVNVANGIDNAIVSGAPLPPGFQNIFNFSPAAIVNALTQLEGQGATDAGKGAMQLMTDFVNLLNDQAIGAGGGGGGGTGGGATGFADEQTGGFPPDLALAYNNALKKPQPADFEQRWSAWGSAYGGTGSYSGNATIGSNNVNASDFGFAGGMNYRPTANSVVGFALAGGGTNWSLSQNLGGGRSDSFQAGLYGKTSWGPLYLSGVLAFANHWFNTSRIALGDDLTAKFQGQSYSARGEVGYRYAVTPMAGVTPYAAVQVQDFHTPGYSETDLTGGGFGLTYSSMSSTDTRSELGARVDDITMLNGLPLILRGRVAWAHD